MKSLPDRLAVYLVADPEHCAGDLIDAVRLALRGGVTAVQLRAKRLTDLELVTLGRSLHCLCQARDALFLINDHVDIALAIGADGVHLGVDDLPIEDARRLGGDHFVIGYSPETDEQTAKAASRGASYLGVGPVFGTRSKADAGSAIGLATIANRAELAGIPIIGIGGVTTDNAASVIEAGAVGVAVISALLRTPDIELAARELSASVKSGLKSE